MNILIVDDRPTNLKLLRAVLEAEGTTVCEAADGLEALAVLQHERVDAVISDILMPRMDGYRLCMELRANGQFCDLPFIAYTATYTSDRDERLMTNLGADCFLRKPASAATLTATLEDVVQSKRRRPPTPARGRPEVDLLKDYNERLIAKLEERNVAREAKSELPTLIEKRASRASVDAGQWLQLLTTSTAAVFVVQDDCIIQANTESARLAAVASPKDLIGRNLFDFMQKDHRLRHPDAMPSAPCPGNLPPLFKHSLQRTDGTVIEIEASAVHFQLDGQPTMLVEARDISERKSAESRLALQQAITGVLSEAAPVSEINQKFLAALGTGLDWDFGELWTIEGGGCANRLRCTASWHLPSDEFRKFAAESSELTFASGKGLPGRVWASGLVEWRTDIFADTVCPWTNQVGPSGLRAWIGFPIKLRQETVGVVGFFVRKAARPNEELIALLKAIGLQMGQFIDRQQLADQLRQAQKMEVIGTLAGGIAHDFNNILGGIYGYCDLARLDAGGNASVIQHLDAMMCGARRATDLVHQILEFSRQHDPERQPIQLKHITTEALRLLRAALPVTIEFQALLSEAPVVLANATQVHQILMNLGTNAAHAMREHGGKLTVKLEDCPVGPELVAAQPELHVGRYACLTVSDTGHGMDSETLGRIYEPFFTTKLSGEGTGLGLAVVRGIVNAHQGAITVSSRRGEGTTFHIYFPAHLADTKKVAGASVDLPRGAGQRILFVDDEVSLAEVGKLVLDHIGYITHTCSNAHQAIDLVTADPAAYALVITDQVMPGMLGTDLAQRLNTIRPDLPIILTTGSMDTLLPDRLRAVGIRQLLAKPLSVHALAMAVHQALLSAATLKHSPRHRA